jgi:hypothetical protein
MHTVSIIEIIIVVSFYKNYRYQFIDSELSKKVYLV